MRIGLVCPYSWDVPGGVQEHIRDLAEALMDLGHEVSVISPADNHGMLPGYVAPAGRAVPVPYNGSVARLAFGPLSAGRVRRWVREGGFDLLHVHEPAAPSLSLLACWVADGPIVATMHGANPRSRASCTRRCRSCSRPWRRSAPGSRCPRRPAPRWSSTWAATPCSSPTASRCSKYEKADPLPGWPGDGGALGFLGRMDEPRKGLPVLKALRAARARRGRGCGC